MPRSATWIKFEGKIIRKYCCPEVWVTNHEHKAQFRRYLQMLPLRPRNAEMLTRERYYARSAEAGRRLTESNRHFRRTMVVQLGNQFCTGPTTSGIDHDMIAYRSPVGPGAQLRHHASKWTLICGVIDA